MTRLSSSQSVLYWRCHPIKYKGLGCPPKCGTGAFQMDMVACPIFDLGRMVVACMYIDMVQADMGVGVSM
jgi:hypothetical protein